MKGDYLGEFEQLVLAAVKILIGDSVEAYGMTIHAKVEEIVAGHRAVSLGAVYTTMDRLEKKGHLKSWMGGATNERGGRSKRYVRLTRSGESALTKSVRTTANMVRALGWIERRALEALGRVVLV